MKKSHFTTKFYILTFNKHSTPSIPLPRATRDTYYSTMKKLFFTQIIPPSVCAYEK